MEKGRKGEDGVLAVCCSLLGSALAEIEEWQEEKSQMPNRGSLQNASCCQRFKRCMFPRSTEHPSSQILVSKYHYLLKQKTKKQKQATLGKQPIPGLAQGKYKMTLEHLVVLECDDVLKKNNEDMSIGMEASVKGFLLDKFGIIRALK